MSDPAESTAARKAYEAWREVIGDPQSVMGESYRWEDMPKRVQEAFRAAAQAGGAAQRKHQVAEVLSRAEAYLARDGGYGHADALAQGFTRTVVQIGDALDSEAIEGDPWRGLDEEERQVLRLAFAAMLAGGHMHLRRQCAVADKEDEIMSDKTLGQVAFEAYRAEVNGQTFDDRQIPGWDELHGNRERVQRGWEAAAQAVVDRHMMNALPGGQRNIPSRWRPVETFTTGMGAARDDDGPVFEPLAPVSEGMVKQAGVAVPVEAGPDEER